MFNNSSTSFSLLGMKFRHAELNRNALPKELASSRHACMLWTFILRLEVTLCVRFNLEFSAHDLWLWSWFSSSEGCQRKTCCLKRSGMFFMNSWLVSRSGKPRVKVDVKKLCFQPPLSLLWRENKSIQIPQPHNQKDMNTFRAIRIHTRSFTGFLPFEWLSAKRREESFLVLWPQLPSSRSKWRHPASTQRRKGVCCCGKVRCSNVARVLSFFSWECRKIYHDPMSLEVYMGWLCREVWSIQV